MKSVRTKQCEVVVIITTILHIILLVGPFVYFVPFSLGVGAKVEQIALSMSSLVSVILVLVSIIIDTTRRAGLHRTALWLITAGIITCLGELSLVFIWIMAGIAILAGSIAHKKALQLNTYNKQGD